MRRHALSLLAVFATICLFASPLAAQGGGHTNCVNCGGGGGGDGDEVAPWITLLAPEDGATIVTATAYVTVDWCDNVSLNSSTKWVKVNGTSLSIDYVSQSPGDCGVHYTSTTTSAASFNLGSNTISAHICDNASNCRTEYWSVTRLAGPTPIVSLTPYSPDVQDYSRCAAACFAATYAQSTVPYLSMDAPHSATLIYNGDRLDPKSFIHVDVTHGGDGSNLPDSFALKVLHSGVAIKFLNGDSLLKFTAATGTRRFGAQFSDSLNSMGTTGVYALTVVVRAYYPAGIEETSATTRVIVINWNNTGVARGWNVAGFQRLYPIGDSALIDEANGSATYFLRSGSGSYSSPTGDFSRLTVSGSGGGTTWTRAYPDSTKVVFNSGGYIYTVTDRFGNVTQFQFDGSGRPSVIQDPTHTGLVSRQITLSYGTYGISSITDPFGRSTSVTDTTNHTLIRITDPDNVSTMFRYDANLRLSAIIGRQQDTTLLAYHSEAGTSSGKLVADTLPRITVFTAAGDSTVRPVALMTPWHHAGVPYSTTHPTAFAPPQVDSVRAWATDPGGHSTWMTVNAFGQPTVTAGTLGDSVHVTYNAAGQPTFIASRLGVNTSFGYDGNGLLNSVVSLGDSTYAHYSGWAQPDSIWGTGRSQRMWIGTAGRMDSLRVGGAFTYRYLYDSRGRITEVHDAATHFAGKTWYTGTNENRSHDSLPTGGAVSFSYDTYGRPTGRAETGMPTRVMSYDAVNRVVRQWDGVNTDSTKYYYGALRLDSVVDPAHQRFGFAYNRLGWLTERKDPNNHSDTYAYDRDGLMRRHTNRRSGAIDQTWDALHRPLIRSGTGIQSDTVRYAADGSGDTTSNANSTEIAFINSRRLADSVRTILRLPNSTTKTFTRRFWYRYSGNLLDSMATVDASSAVSFVSRGYSYSPARGTVDGIRIGASGWTNLAYNSDLSLSNISFPGSDTLAVTYTNADEASRVNSFILDDTLHYDAFGRLNRFKTDDGRDREFAYDSLGRLQRTIFRTSTGYSCTNEYFNGWLCGAVLDSAKTFTYDPVGNRTAVIRDTVYTFHNTYATYGTGDRITAFGPCAYQTDLDGNVTSRRCSDQYHQRDSLTWSPDGRLSRVVTNSDTLSGDTVAFYYDSGGRLVRRDAGSSPASWYLWNGNDLLSELGSGATSKVAEYSYYGADAVHAVVIGSTPYFAHTDAASSPRGYSNSGSRYGAYSFDEWGHLDAGSSGLSGADRARWKGALLVEPTADLYYMRNRWYEPMSGRFLSEDPTGLDAGINPYVFAGGDPVGGRDPSGLGNPQQCIRSGTEYTMVHWIDATHYETTKWTVWDRPVCFQQSASGGSGAPMGTLHTHSIPVSLPAGLPGHGEAVLRCAGSLTSLTANIGATTLIVTAALPVVEGVAVAGGGILASIAGPSPDAAWNRGSALIGYGLKLLVSALNPATIVSAMGLGGDVLSGNFSAMSFVPVIGLPSAASAALNNCIP